MRRPSFRLVLMPEAPKRLKLSSAPLDIATANSTRRIRGNFRSPKSGWRLTTLALPSLVSVASKRPVIRSLRLWRVQKMLTVASTPLSTSLNRMSMEQWVLDLVARTRTYKPSLNGTKRLVRLYAASPLPMKVCYLKKVQQEPRFFTHYSQDAALIEGYKNPEFSIHQRANDLMFNGVDYDKAKRMAMGILSMMMPRALSGHLRIPYSEAKELRNRFLYDAFPDIGEFQATAVNVFRSRGYVKSILGRRARMESARFDYRAVSRIIQNSGGDHNKTCLLRAMEYEEAYPDKIQVLMPIHDSVIWQRDPSHSPKDLVAVMENVANEFQLSIPIPFEVGSGTNWADASYGEKIKSKKGWQI
jgi:hypothetical protein